MTLLAISMLFATSACLVAMSIKVFGKVGARPIPVQGSSSKLALDVGGFAARRKGTRM